MSNIWSFIALIASAQGVFLGLILLFHPKLNKLKRLYLSILVISFSLWLGEFAGYWSPYILKYPHLAFTTRAFPWLFGPLSFLFANEFIKEKSGFKIKHLLHFIPFFMRLLLYFPIYLKSKSEKIEILNIVIYSKSPHFNPWFFILEIAMFIQISFYLFIIYKLLLATPKLKIVKVLIFGILLFALLILIHVVNIILYDYRFIFISGATVLLICSLLIYSLSYYIIINPSILISNSNEKYSKNKLSTVKITEIEDKLLDYLLIKKNYHNKQLTLNKVSKDISIPSNYISIVINSKFNLNFKDLINQLRVEEIKENLLDSKFKHYSIIAIAEDAGFSNKATFYNAFKKHVGQTPSEFKKYFLDASK